MEKDLDKEIDPARKKSVSYDHFTSRQKYEHICLAPRV